MERLIFHVDVNSAFLSWEAVRRVKNGESDVRLIPSCIGGDPNSRRGIVLAKSIPAKKYGIVTGEPIGLALQKCPELMVLPADFKLYAASSRAFKSILREYAPVVEEFSIDEAFLDMSGTALLYPDPLALAHTMKNRIRDELGFTVNVGIGRNKLCAKMASDFEKPDKVHTLFPEEIESKLWPLPVGDLLFVGRSSVRRLETAGIRTIGELGHADPKLLASLLGEKMSRQAYRYANGIDDSPVRAEPEIPKGFSNEVTLEEDVVRDEQAHAVLLSLADCVSARLRDEGYKAQGISVTVRYLNFQKRSHQCMLERATHSSRTVYETSKKLLSELWADHRPLRLMGIAATNLLGKDEPEEGQLSLFGEEDSAAGRKNEKLDQALDSLRRRFGSGAVKRGASMTVREEVARKYKGKSDSER